MFYVCFINEYFAAGRLFNINKLESDLNQHSAVRLISSTSTYFYQHFVKITRY